MAIVSPGAVVTDVQSVATFQGSEITDATRVAAQSWTAAQQGGSTDGLTPPAGVGIWEGRTNLYPRGQNDATTNIVNSAGVTVSVDAATPAPFSPQSIKAVADGTGVNQRIRLQSNTGQAAAAGTIGAGSVYFQGVAGQSYNVFLSWVNTDSSETVGVSTTLNATGAMQQVTPATLAVAVGKTGTALTISVQINGQRAETFWAAHAELESGVPYVGPYIATSQGATATRANAYVRAPVSLLNLTQGWFATRLRMGFASTQGTTDNPRVFSWRDDSNNVLEVGWTAGTGNFFSNRAALGVGAGPGATIAWAAGDAVTIVFAWTATALSLSANGAAFTTVANSSIPTLAATTFAIGSRGDGIFQLDGRCMWFACGSGLVTSSDAAAFTALPDTMPGVFLDVAASLSGRWLAYAPVGRKFRRVNVGEPVVIAG